jgi:hypothetical protein
MNSKLLRNGDAFCEIIPSTIHRFPEDGSGWQDCVVVTDRRIEPRLADALSIQPAGKRSMPFIASRSRIGIEGWELVGKLLA